MGKGERRIVNEIRTEAEFYPTWATPSRDRQRFTVITGIESKEERDRLLGPFLGSGVAARAAAKATAEHVGVDNARVERDGSHAARQLFGEGAGQPFDRPFAGA